MLIQWWVLSYTPKFLATFKLLLRRDENVLTIQEENITLYGDDVKCRSLNIELSLN